MTALISLFLAVAVGLGAVHGTRLWLPQLLPPAIPVMLALLGGARLGGYIARERRGENVEHSLAWAAGFLIVGFWSWQHPAALVLPFVTALYALGAWLMQKRSYPALWPERVPARADVESGPPRPLIGTRPAYRNPDGSWR